ncbi:F-box protein At3g07870-like [Salvia hispanica]|uniref:F-box protein At3g07870-like n=1 Tax=Salvia hispanica TaxID=49212 RepID=UPI0020093843|nr:F-box protein At3g07870-like [Salvia hispanica]
MEQDFFTNLPLDINTNILSRLPLRSIAISKCVCKPWLNLLESNDFEIKTPPALARVTSNNWLSHCMIFEIEDEEEADLDSHDLHYNRLTDSKIYHGSSIAGVAANGSLLLLVVVTTYSNPTCCLHICNPITRKYVYLDLPEAYTCYLSFGFGLSKISGQYKVVCINTFSGSHHVYTLGTGTWRRLEDGAPSGFNLPSITAQSALNGNPHWTLRDPKQRMWICGFDVETECFSIFSTPPPIDGRGRLNGKLAALRDCLCYSYTWDDEIVIWLMKEYQVEESWTIEYKLSTTRFGFDKTKILYVIPIKIFKDGDILMLMNSNQLIYYSNKTRTTQKIDMFKDASKKCTFALIFTPSLLSLESFGIKNVLSF